jgi:uncharacterized protein
VQSDSTLLGTPGAVELGDGETVSKRTYRPAESPAVALLVLGHGAGTSHDHASIVVVALGLASRGIETVTFNFPYREAKRRVPDRPDVLERCFRAVIASARRSAHGLPVFIGGKSLGGRMASHLAAVGDSDLAGLVCLGYPLHPPNKPEKLRVEHLPRIRIPVLIVQGSRDAFGTPDELRPHLGTISAPVSVVVVEQGDHSFRVPKRVASADEVMRRALDEIAGWVRERVRVGVRA